ncbi:helix-turn-helix domain-containing protein [Sandaracinobacteroides saxicola]|uniref:helix-turn-helix domain-containing protein n=1 Tax=Sandaracinobacteroides saxicola TaxID=2759707 RepID=UPI001FB1785D|nr:helix-turn-helix transcriptional regulator [Sandaracinobacteroides saxicola]
MASAAESNRKLFAGPRVRRLRTSLGLTQTRMAQDLGVSISYLNLIERNQRPVTAAVLLRLADLYDLDVRTLTDSNSDRLSHDVTATLAAEPAISRAEIRDFIEAHPTIAAALTRLASTAPSASAAPTDPLATVRRAMLDRQNHFATLDAHAEAVSDELRLSATGLYAALQDRLRARHGLTLRVLPTDVMPGALRRLDWHNRQLHLSEALDGASRTFQAAHQLALLDAKAEITAEVAAASLADPIAQRIFTANLASYWAAALMMPYARFHAAAEALGYDLELLQARFGAGFEQVAHRLTTLQRAGARGIPFIMLRVDRAGQISKRLAAGRFPFAEEGGQCPLWVLHAAFESPTRILTQVAEVESGERLFTIARTVRPQVTPWGAVQPRFAIALSCGLDHARGLTYATGLDLMTLPPTPIGSGCTACRRDNCRQRSAPPSGATLAIDPAARGLTAFQFT